MSQEAGIVEERVQRRLAAILAADAVGYSRLMGEDEAGTLARLKALRADLIDPTITKHAGRIVKEMGDGLLVEFASVVNAVQCAVGVQEGLAGRNADEPEDRRIEFRIGINIGDVIVEGDDIYGDGVNIAARLEGLAEPSGICIAGKVYDEVKGKLDLRYEDLGEQPVKNIAEPIRVYRVEIGTKIAAATASTDTFLDRPAVAVLPFVNMSGDPEQEYFVDGLTEDIITALAHWRWFPVIDRTSVFAYKGTRSTVRQVAKVLRARYVLEGSVRKGGNRLRITAQLIDASTGHHVWAKKFDRELSDVFQVQDEITQTVAAAVEPELGRTERERSKAKPAQNLDAWDYYQRGMSLFHQRSNETNAQARTLFERALDLDPTFSRASAAIANSYFRDADAYHPNAREENLAKSIEAAQRAVALDSRDSFAHWILGVCYWRIGQYDLAIAGEERAIELNPSNALAHAHLGNILGYVGRAKEGIPYIERALRLNALSYFFSMMARIHLTARHYEEAVEWAKKATYRSPKDAYPHILRAASLGHLGRKVEAGEALGQCRQLEPGRLEREVRTHPPMYQRHEDGDHFLDGLRGAGWRG